MLNRYVVCIVCSMHRSIQHNKSKQFSIALTRSLREESLLHWECQARDDPSFLVCRIPGMWSYTRLLFCLYRWSYGYMWFIVNYICGILITGPGGIAMTTPVSLGLLLFLYNNHTYLGVYLGVYKSARWYNITKLWILRTEYSVYQQSNVH